MENTNSNPIQSKILKDENNYPSPLIAPTSIIHKISLSNKNEENSDELNDLMKEIIENKTKDFLEGKENPIDYIISKYTMKKSDEFIDLKSLTLKVKRNFGILNEFGIKLINLQELNLTLSTIFSVSELGSSFSNLLLLNLSNCFLQDLTGKILLKIFLGIICFKKLISLDCSCNFLSDLIELEMCYTIQFLNLEQNQIEDGDNIIYLSGLNQLKSLNLNKNRVQSIDGYKSLVLTYMPDLHVLDGEKIHGKNENLIKDNSLIESEDSFCLSL